MEELLDADRVRYLGEDGEPVGEKLANLTNQLWDKGRDCQRLRECYEQHARPSNVHKIDINDEVVNAIPQHVKVRDIRLRAAQGVVARAAVPTMKVMEQSEKLFSVEVFWIGDCKQHTLILHISV